MNAPTITTPSQTINDYSISIQWTDVEHAENYSIYIDDEYNKTVTENETILTFSANGEYNIIVYAVNGSLVSEVSNIIPITVEVLITTTTTTTSTTTTKGTTTPTVDTTMIFIFIGVSGIIIIVLLVIIGKRY